VPPATSVILPYRDAASTIEIAIRSVLQGEPADEVELLAIDDAQAEEL